MRLFGFEISRARAKALSGLSPVMPGSGGWLNIVREPFMGAWQRNVEIKINSVLTHTTVFACRSLISSDIAKCRMRLVQKDAEGIWHETDNAAFSPVLRKPNRFQTRIQFFESWVDSKLIHGNAYILKERDARNVVIRMYVLDPMRITVLVAPDGSVWYEVRTDHLSGVSREKITFPASEIIHDRWNTIFHPLVGISPIQACGIAAMQGLRILETSTHFFEGGANPSGLLVAPTGVKPEDAAQLKVEWNAAYGPGGHSQGKVAVLQNDMKYIPMTMTAQDAQLIEQLKMTSETIASAFHVPAYMVGVGPALLNNNVEALNQQYYGQCLQKLMEDIEEVLDHGLGMGPQFGNAYGTEFDITDLLRMDTKTKTEAARQAIQSGMSPNEIRNRYFDLGSVPGGETPYLQEQQWPIRHLAERPLPTRQPTAPAPMENADDGASPDDTADATTDTARAFYAEEILRRSQSYYVSSAS